MPPAEALLTDATVITMDASRRAFTRGFVHLRGELIAAVGPMAECPAVPGAEVRRLPGCVVVPGLVNCHTHLSNAVVRGAFDELPLAAWMAGAMWNTLRAVDREAARAGAALSLLEGMLQGVTTYASGEFATPHRDGPDGVLEAARTAGARVVLARMALDSADTSAPSQLVPPEFREPVALAVSEVERLRAAWNGPLLEVVPEALGILRCSRELVEALHALAVREGTLFSMHLASSPDELHAAHARFGHGSAAELARIGCLGPRTLLAHAVWLDDDEIALVAEHGAGISHNPVANAFYACGLARLPELLAAGARVGLGTDGASTNNSQNLWDTAKMAMFFQKNAREDANFGSAELALELLTIGGARALHLEDRIGSLEPGKQADLVVIDGERPALAPRVTLPSSLVYSNDPHAVRSVWVAGVERVRDGRHLQLEQGAVIEEATRQAGCVLDASGLGAHLAARSRWSWQR